MACDRVRRYMVDEGDCGGKVVVPTILYCTLRLNFIMLRYYTVEPEQSLLPSHSRPHPRNLLPKLPRRGFLHNFKGVLRNLATLILHLFLSLLKSWE